MVYCTELVTLSNITNSYNLKKQLKLPKNYILEWQVDIFLLALFCKKIWMLVIGGLHCLRIPLIFVEPAIGVNVHKLLLHIVG
jgi:hypothetical protein